MPDRLRYCSGRQSVTLSCRWDSGTGVYTPVPVRPNIPAFAARDMSHYCPGHVPPSTTLHQVRLATNFEGSPGGFLSRVIGII